MCIFKSLCNLFQETFTVFGRCMHAEILLKNDILSKLSISDIIMQLTERKVYRPAYKYIRLAVADPGI